jgi:hypothetical protein
MAKIVSSFSIIAISLGLLLHAGAAEATTARTWVSGTGSDSNPCTRAAPCATFATAYAATSAGGEIDVLNGGDYGALTIAHAITIASDGDGAAAITPTGLFSSAFLISAGSADAVVLRGLNLNGAISQNAGVQFAGGGSLLIDHCEIQGFSNGDGIDFEPGSAAKLWVTDTVLSNNGTSAGASVFIAPLSAAAVIARFERVQVLHAIGNGIRVEDSFGGGAIDLGLHDVTVDGAASSGIVAVSATSGGPAIKIMADDVTSSHNNGFGLRAVGGTASIFLRRSTVTGNTVGIAASGGGVMATYGDNGVTDNVNGDGAATTMIPPK